MSTRRPDPPRRVFSVSKLLLAYTVDAALPLTGKEDREEFDRLVAKDDDPELTALANLWPDPSDPGADVERVRVLLLAVLESRFGTVPKETEEAIRALSTKAELDGLVSRALEVPSLEDLQV